MANERVDIRLTEGDDLYVWDKTSWAFIYTLGGNDTVRASQGADIDLGPGNDTLINLSGSRWVTAIYKAAPQMVFVDLQAGYALDGYGTRDTLVDIHRVMLAGINGDEVRGSATEDEIWFDQRNNSTVIVDGRGGSDTLVFYSASSKDFKVDVSLDGRSATLTKGTFVVKATNIESVQFLNNGKLTETASLVSLIDFQKIGPATLIDKRTDGWSNGAPKALTFSYMSAPPTYGGAEGGTGFVPVTDAYKAAVNTLMGRLWLETGLAFTEVPDTADSYGQIRFGANQQAKTKGYAFIPGQTPDARAGDVWLDTETLQVMGQGQEGWQVLLHEIGHALGLSHPHSESETTTATVLLNQWNDNSYTVMSANQSPSELWQSWFGPLDIQALQSLYGTGRELATGNDVYVWADSQGQSLSTLRDVGGNDRLDLSQQTFGVYLDLQPGSFSSVGTTREGFVAFNNVFIDNSSTIEEVVGSLSDDVLFGNSADNLFFEMGGKDVIEGRGGVNTVVFTANRSAYNIGKSEVANHWLVEGVNGSLGSDDLINVTRLQFADTKVRLDVDGNPTMAAKLIGVVLGGDWVKSTVIAGIALGALESGFQPLTLARLGLESGMFLSLAGSAGNADFYNTVYKNVYGSKPDLVTLQNAVTQLDSGKLTQSDMVLQMIDLAPNLQNIDLVGIQLHGFDYV
jgi:hypothetical protein